MTDRKPDLKAARGSPEYQKAFEELVQERVRENRLKDQMEHTNREIEKMRREIKQAEARDYANRFNSRSQFTRRLGNYSWNAYNTITDV